MAQNGARPTNWHEAFELVRSRGYERRAGPFVLASGELSHDYIDGK
jgi:orotate phosphoribosyltransferase